MAIDPYPRARPYGCGWNGGWGGWLEQPADVVVGVLLAAGDLADEHQLVAVEDGVDYAKRPHSQAVDGATKLNRLSRTRFVNSPNEGGKHTALVVTGEPVKLTLSARP